jgi:hypothetical protein
MAVVVASRTQILTEIRSSFSLQFPGVQCKCQTLRHGEVFAGATAGLWYGLRSSRDPKIVASCVFALGLAGGLKEELMAEQ